MKAAISLILSMGLVAPAMAATDFDQRILAVHNRERVKLDLKPLTWSNRLASDAAPWAAHLAETGALEHSPAGTRAGEGENLWLGTAKAYDAEQMAGAWAREKIYFHAGRFPDDVSVGDWEMVGHYTQMIWKSTTEVGCALASGAEYDVLVCRYSPPGNIVGRKPY